MNININTQDLNDQTLFETLTQDAHEKKQQHLTALFTDNPQRFKQHSLQFDQLTFDYSKHRIDQQVMQHLYDFAQQKKLNEWIARLFSNEQINFLAKLSGNCSAADSCHVQGELSSVST